MQNWKQYALEQHARAEGLRNGLDAAERSLGYYKEAAEEVAKENARLQTLLGQTRAMLTAAQADRDELAEELAQEHEVADETMRDLIDQWNAFKDGATKVTVSDRPENAVGYEPAPWPPHEYRGGEIV